MYLMPMPSSHFADAGNLTSSALPEDEADGKNLIRTEYLPDAPTCRDRAGEALL